MAPRTTGDSVDEVDRIVGRLAGYVPRLADPSRQQAATALVLHPHTERGVSVLFVERAVRRGDRWSGQMALPGGRRDPDDPDLAATAVRETHEEVGVVLGEPVGRLDDVGGRTSALVVSPFVFVVDDEPEVVPDPREVQAAVWIPVDHLRSPEAVTLTFWRGVGPFPALRYRRFVVWGLTHRIVTRFLAVVDGERR